MKRNYLFTAITAALAVGGAAVMSCCSSSPVEKAERIKGELPANATVMSADLMGENPSMIVCEENKDGYAVTVRSVSNGKIDTLLTAGSDNEPCEVVRVDGGYLVVRHGNEGYKGAPDMYYASIIRDGKDTEPEELLIDEEAAALGADAYVIDRKNGRIKLSGYVNTDDEVKIYATVYDFTGKKISDEPTVIKMRKAVEKKSNPDFWDALLGSSVGASSSDNEIYVWECSYCHRKANGKYTPQGQGTCQARPTGNGGYWGHVWVKLHKVE